MQTIILLHGALGASDQMQLLRASLSRFYKVHIFNFTGHGGEPFGHQPFSMELFAADILRYMDGHGIERASLFGFSMGGYAALCVALKWPERVQKVIAFSTKLCWTPEIAARECAMMDPEKIAAKVPAFAAMLEERHKPNDWKTVLSKTQKLLTSLGNDSPLKMVDYQAIKSRVMLLMGDRDKMVTQEEVTEVYNTIPNACMGILPNTNHPIEQVDVLLLTNFIDYFMNT
jgi:pimeloyl-ACP methyl ester carboxylesterase